jgi:hypothetical protein
MSIFNIFKKEAILNKEAIMNDAPISVSKAIYPKEVLEIHNEFNIAADKLLLEATAVIKEAESKDTQKVSRLEALGFKQTKQVIELKPLLQQAELSKEQIELVSYYKREYPFNKFITEEQVKTICHKYNLVCGDVDRFKGFVPEKNLREIEAFKLKSREKNVLIGSNGLIFEDAEIRRIDDGYYHIYKTNEKSQFNRAFQSSDGKVFYGDDSKNIFNYKILPPNIKNISRSTPNFALSFTISNNTLQICAPVKDMDISGLELKEGYKLEKKFIPDPVVLQPVKFGFLILTMWADEAFDPFVEPILRNDTVNN